MKRSVGLIDGAMKTSEAGASSATSSSICESAIIESSCDLKIDFLDFGSQDRSRGDAFSKIRDFTRFESVPLATPFLPLHAWRRHFAVHITSCVWLEELDIL